jgi:16S rRNA (guanine(966)-N(2))-methyltransferase RsmD
LKVVGGIARGRRLKVSKTNLRPTSEKVKEALFNILGEKVKDSVFLDLYAGTGGIGIEALSRGAGKAIFVESNPLMKKTLRENLSSLGFVDRAEVIESDAGVFLKRAIKKGERFDILFIDPPYYTGEMEKIFKILSKGNVLSEDGIVVAEHFKKKGLPEETGPLRLIKRYVYGDTVLSLFMMKG